MSVDEHGQILDSFFDLEGASLAIARRGFTQERLFDRVINHIEDPDPKVSLTAIHRFWSMMKDIAAMNGRLASHSVTERTDEHTTRQIASTQVLLSRLQRREPLNAHFRPPDELPSHRDPSGDDGVQPPA